MRETRRVYGEYRLTKEDCLGGRQFDDQIALCGAPIEDHSQGAAGDDETVWAYIKQEAGAYGVPYGTLVPKSREELWVVGRCFSATHDAHASCRSMGQTMSMGQAAGCAAAISLDTDAGARGINIRKLQDRLRRIGAVLERPHEIAETASEAWRRNRMANLRTW